MKMTFLGVGNAFTTQEFWQSNICFEYDGDRFLFDCGSDIRFSLVDQFPDLKNNNIHEYLEGVYISHVHEDHSGGLEWLGFCTYFNPKCPKPILVCHKDIVEELWEESLKGGMAAVEGKTCTLEDYFEVNTVDEDDFKFGAYSARVVKRVHVDSVVDKYSYGLMIDGDKKVYLTSDVTFDKDVKEYEEADLIFQDCETTPFKTNVHSNYEDLKTLPDDIKGKMWLYHYQPDSNDKYDPVEDGFLGFVKKGQSFEI